jgi:pyruvate dehydrogenase E1 component beta subunit
MPVIYYRQALNHAMREEMRRDPDVFMIGEEVAQYQGAYRVTEGLLDEFGADRVRDTPIAEEVIVGIGVGAAMLGLRPVVELMTINFSLLAIDQIVNHAAKIPYMSNGQFRVPLVVRCPEGAGMQLGAKHSQHFEAWFAHIPGLIVVAPATPYDAKGLLKSSIRDDNPVIFIENQLLYTTKGEVPDDDYTVPLGKANVAREGTDVTIVTYLRMLSVALKAADVLAGDGISAEVIDLRTLRPLDMTAVLDSVRKTNRVVIVEEDWPQFGIGAQIADDIQKNAFDYLDAPVSRVTSEDVPMPYSRDLELSALPDEGKVVAAVRKVLEGSSVTRAVAASI